MKDIKDFLSKYRGNIILFSVIDFLFITGTMFIQWNIDVFEVAAQSDSRVGFLFWWGLTQFLAQLTLFLYKKS